MNNVLSVSKEGLLENIEVENTEKAVEENEKIMTDNINAFDTLSLNHYLPKPLKELLSLDDVIAPVNKILDYETGITENSLMYTEKPMSLVISLEMVFLLTRCSTYYCVG